ncbi:MAG: CapA family protein [Porticoccaceae bacterium]
MAAQESGSGDVIRLCLGGDVMTGRGIDQILAHPSAPWLRESWVASARTYVELAERAHGPIPRPVADTWIWGDALDELAQLRPDLRIFNLETSVTISDACLPKGINYRMRPANIGCLTAAGIDGCVLANNHVLDWGEAGLRETLATLNAAGIACAGAGRDGVEAAQPALLDVAGKGRVVVFAVGVMDSGIPPDWAAGIGRPGVNWIERLGARAVERIAARVRAVKCPGDVVVVSIHWGGNWGYEIPHEQQVFARSLIDTAAVDVVHGHSSHHPRAFEIHRGKLILYGCGDLLNDYEGIRGHAEYRGDLSLLYFLDLDPGSGELRRLVMTPLQIRNFRLRRAAPADAEWLRATLDRESGRRGAGVEVDADGRLVAHWRRGLL